MQFAILGDHREHFRQNGLVEFKSLINPQELLLIRQEIEHLLPVRPQSAWECLLMGRDLTRRAPSLRRIGMARRLGRVGADLTEASSVRFAYDQLLGLGGGRHQTPEAQQFFESSWSLQERSSFQNVTCGLILALTDSEAESPQFPKKAGHGVYLKADQKFDWSELLTLVGAEFWMLVYGVEKLIYISNLADPHAHRPKSYGYVVGDRLRESDCPLLS